ncbi:restriction endonuclease subunit S [Streptomyces europaeiscabiei]|uniref:restriction endonuclease subunit S n=1 Tax=Streptomyces europaeiscabiei TaxID=146819 RepID=UPI0038F7E429
MSVSFASRWGTRRLKWSVSKIGSGKTPSGGAEAYADYGVTFLRSQNIHFDGLRLDEVAYIDEATHRGMWGTRVMSGDVLLNITGASIGRVAYATSDLGRANVNQHVCIVRPTSEFSTRYLAYALGSRPVQEQIRELQVGGNREGLNFEQVGNLMIPAAHRDEQRRIADYLDTEVGKIDNLVAKKRHLVALLNERIDSRVLQHVGASQLVNTESGFPALPIRRLLSKVSRPAVADVGVITAYRDGQVTERGARRAEGYTLSASIEPQGQHVQVGDVVVHGLDGFAGAIGTSEAEGNCSPVYHVCVPQGEGDARFLGRLLRLLALQGYLGNFATSTRERAVDFRNWDLFGRIPIPQVPPNEQREIGEWISKVRPLREVIERSASLAAERRQALITATVTGQLDISTASGRNVSDGVPA